MNIIGFYHDMKSQFIRKVLFENQKPPERRLQYFLMNNCLEGDDSDKYQHDQ